MPNYPITQDTVGEFIDRTNTEILNKVENDLNKTPAQPAQPNFKFT